VTSGLSGQVNFLVTEDDIATALGSGDVPVLATPRVLAWLEAATVAALAASLEPGSTSVGSRIELVHERPTPVGSQVVASAEVIHVDGRLVRFHAVAEHTTPAGDVAVAATAQITRVIVDRERFIARLP
jgi:predicted thioesterase